MFSKNLIKKLTLQYQTTEINITREYVQHLFLSIFYQQPNSETILSKGGTALHSAFQSPRFSEDRDCSGFRTNISMLETLILDVLNKIQGVGLKVEIAESKKTSGGYLGILDLTFSGYQNRISLEISLRKKNNLRGEPMLITSNFIPSYTILLLPRKMLVDEKLSALLSRAKPRDYFDLYFLLRKGLVEVEKRKVLKEIKSRLEKDKPLVKKELENFLPRNQHRLVLNFREILLQEISHYL